MATTTTTRAELVLYSQKQLLEYLSSLSHDVLFTLYKGDSSEFACQAVFRALPAQARAYVLRAVAGQPLAETSFPWKGNVKEHDTAMGSLLRLKILEVTVDKKRAGTTQFKLSEAFAKGIKLALVGNVPGNSSHSIRNHERSEDFAAEQWNAVLSFLVSSTEGTMVEDGAAKKVIVKERPQKRARMNTSSPVVVPPSTLDEVVQEALRSLNFVKQDDERGQHITSAGYEFMLKDVFEQVWIVAQHFSGSLSEKVQGAFLRFLFRISFLPPGAEMTLSETQLPPDCIAFLKACGLLMESTSNRVVITSLGVHAIFPPSSQKKLMVNADRQLGLSGMKIIVETTFKVFCYTTSPMHSQMLQLFCEIEARLPNLVVAMITRESVSDAFKKGISDEQLISFLQQNAHPITLTTRRNIVPDNVTDQIRLWRRETERVSVSYGRLFMFDKQPVLYAKLMEFHELETFMPWKDDSTKRFFVTNEGNNIFKQLLQQARQNLGQVM